MSFLAKLFGHKSKPAKAPLLTPPPATPPPPGTPLTLTAWDAYGRICEIPREEWRTQVLPLNFQNNWHDAEKLAGLIHNALNDHFVADCLEPARQLYRIDPQPKRAASYLVVILLHMKQFTEAEKVISGTMRQHGEDGVLMTNLAKVHSGRGDEALAERTLWRALELDPNQDNGFDWYVAIHRERDGESAALATLRRIAALPGSWRAQLWLARAALTEKQLDLALTLYQNALSQVNGRVPGDLLMQMSGDLGNAGYLNEIIAHVEPRFEAKIHGLEVGNNLLKAHLELREFAAVQSLLDQLYAQNRGDWKEHLAYWDTKLAKARVAARGPVKDDQISIAMLTVDGPVWLKPGSSAAELFPAQTDERVTVAFLGSTADIATNSKRTEQKLSDTPGRISRALPLFLAEQVEFCSATRAQTLVPWITGDSPGFVLGGVPWEDAAAAGFARQGEIKSDYLVVTHLKPITEPWTVELRLIRTIDAQNLGALVATFPSAQPEQGLPDLARRLLVLLHEHAEVEPHPVPSLYQWPVGSHFPHYLLRLEQLLAIRCAGMDGVPSGFFHGEREVLDGNLQLCLDHPANVSTRILLVQTLAAFKRARPEILPEFKERIALLQKEKPLPEPAQGVVERMINEALGV